MQSKIPYLEPLKNAELPPNVAVYAPLRDVVACVFFGTNSTLGHSCL